MGNSKWIIFAVIAIAAVIAIIAGLLFLRPGGGTDNSRLIIGSWTYQGAVYRFLDDGTVIDYDGSHHTYRLEGDMLILEFGGGVVEYREIAAINDYSMTWIREDNTTITFIRADDATPSIVGLWRNTRSLVGETFHFTAAGEFFNTSLGSTQSGTYTFDGEIIHVTYNQGNQQQWEVRSFDGNVMTVHIEGKGTFTLQRTG